MASFCGGKRRGQLEQGSHWEGEPPWRCRAKPSSSPAVRRGSARPPAFLLARKGARVFVGDVDEAGGRAAVAEGAAEGLPIQYLALDLTDTTSIEVFAAAVHERVERVDGLVNGAGWDQIQPFLENPPEMWDRLIAINLMGAVRLTRDVLPPMVAAVCRQDRQHIERCWARRQHGRDRLRRRKRRADRVHQVARPASWRATRSTSTACVPARPIRRCSNVSPSG